MVDGDLRGTVVRSDVEVLVERIPVLTGDEEGRWCFHESAVDIPGPAVLWIDAAIRVDPQLYDELESYCEEPVELPRDVPRALGLESRAPWFGGGRLIPGLGVVDRRSTTAALARGWLYVRIHV
ncbi:MAG: hypothetical protein SPH79_03505 [Schaalia hyovaginalis]|uniref:hypothetical protein n=1 Tax=Schaalia hyovaginalis TaxID=29316 RepID=UPI002A91B101|nr:hypothetical protein [Schaalia hyovaginalis]MDY6213541.1 hypothetical protein [Schaalia hyovaginalis]